MGLRQLIVHEGTGRQVEIFELLDTVDRSSDHRVIGHRDVLLAGRRQAILYLMRLCCLQSRQWLHNHLLHRSLLQHRWVRRIILIKMIQLLLLSIHLLLVPLYEVNALLWIALMRPPDFYRHNRILIAVDRLDAAGAYANDPFVTLLLDE